MHMIRTHRTAACIQKQFSEYRAEAGTVPAVVQFWCMSPLVFRAGWLFSLLFCLLK